LSSCSGFKHLKGSSRYGHLIYEEKKKPAVRADLLWKELLESFLYPALEIYYPELYAAVDLDKPPVLLNKELRVPGLHKANKEEKILDLLMDVPLKTGELIRILLFVEVQGGGSKASFHIRMRDYACVITLTQKRPFAALAIRTTPKGKEEQLTYEMNCFGTRHTFIYPTAFVDQMDEEDLLAKKENPVALATVCVIRMLRAEKDERKRYQYAKELLKFMKDAGYSVETTIRLMQFIEGMTGLSTAKLKSALRNDLEQEIMKMLGEVKDMTTVRTPLLRKALKKAAQDIFRAEGKNEGETERKFKDARRMLLRGIGIDVIADVTELSEEEVRSLQNKGVPAV
jgi:hypothetical protein